MIVNLRGTNGAGKSFVGKRLIEKSQALPIHDRKGKIEAYEGKLFGLPFYVLGVYDPVPQGLDRVSSVQEMIELVAKYASISPKVLIFYESLILSHSYGTLGKASEIYGDRHVFAFLDTPLETCIQRIRDRRKTSVRKRAQEFNPKNVIYDHMRVNLTKGRIKEIGRKVVTVPHDNPVRFILRIFKNGAIKIHGGEG